MKTNTRRSTPTEAAAGTLAGVSCPAAPIRVAIMLILMVWVGTALLPAGGHSEIGESSRTRDTDHTQVTLLRLGTLRGPSAVSFAPLLHSPGELGYDGYQLSAQLFATPDLLVSQLLAGRIDVAALPTNLAALLYNREGEVLLAGIMGTGVLYIVADTELDWDDLRGRTVYTIARGATPDILFRALAVEAGLVPGADFELEYAVDQVELAQSLIAGRRRLAVVPEPFVTRVTTAGVGLLPAIDLQQEWVRLGFGSGGPPMTALVVTRRFAEDHPAALAALIEAYQRGIERFAADPAAVAAEAGQQNIGIDAATIEAAYTRLNMTWIPASAARPDVEAFLNVLFREAPASVGGRLPDASFYLSLPE